MKKLKKPAKLIQTWFAPAHEEGEFCFTCQYHNKDSEVLATRVRIRQYDRGGLHKTFFCDKHAESAQQAEVSR